MVSVLYILPEILCTATQSERINLASFFSLQIYRWLCGTFFSKALSLCYVCLDFWQVLKISTFRPHPAPWNMDLSVVGYRYPSASFSGKLLVWSQGTGNIQNTGNIQSSCRLLALSLVVFHLVSKIMFRRRMSIMTVSCKESLDRAMKTYCFLCEPRQWGFLTCYFKDNSHCLCGRGHGAALCNQEASGL